MHLKTKVSADVARRVVELRMTAPYDFALAAGYLRRSPSAVLERIDDASSYARALTFAERDVLLRLRGIGTVDEPRLALEIVGETVDERVEAEAVRLVRRVFSLDEDVTPFLAIAGRDAVFGGLVRRHPGLRPVLIADPYEALLWAVIGQQITVGFARKLKETLTALCGRCLTVDGHDYWLVPRPEAVAALDPAALRARQFSGQKTAYVIGLSRAICEGELRLDDMGALPHEDAIAALARFKGIGRWTAEYVLMRGLGARDSIPAADIGLRAVIGQWYGLGRKASEAEVRERAEAWTGWRGWAAFYWWNELQSKREPEAERKDAIC
jgi:DNA-3-methyladenine glycosylase II